MNYVFSMDNSAYMFYIPIIFMPFFNSCSPNLPNLQSTTLQAKNEKPNIKEYRKIKLNITRQDLASAGYNYKRNNWTEQEDQKLLELFNTQNKNWVSISKKMVNRNPMMCYSRLRRLNYQIKKRWTISEEKIIEEGIQKYGLNWRKIAEKLKGRSMRQIQQHYEFCLQPNLDKSCWTIEQDLQLINLLEQYGNDWKLISKKIQRRTENQIKNRYFGRLLKISEAKKKERFQKLKQTEEQKQFRFSL